LSSLLLRLRQVKVRRTWLAILIALLVLLLAYRQGRYPSPRFLTLLVAAGGVALLLQHPELGLHALVVAALAVPMRFSTGTEVMLNPATLLVPALLALWVAHGLLRRELRLAPSRAYRPLVLFLLAGLLSVGLGYVTWAPTVPRPRNILLVQLGQWAIFAFAGGAFLLAANLYQDERALRRLVFFYLAVAGGMALLRVLPGAGPIFGRLSTGAVDRAPFWMLLAALAGGQLLYNAKLGMGWRLFLLATLAAVLVYSFRLQQETVSNWVGVAVVAGVLAWLRFPRLRWLVIPALIVLTLTGVLVRAVYGFAGGQREWEVSGGSRLTLILRVIEVTLRNPLTGLGPAAYRAYAATKPLAYGRALWWVPAVNSHNNYVDLFAHVGLIGLGLFLWFMAEVGLLGWRLHGHKRSGFLAGYVDSMVASWVGAMVLMALADWILPHVYNIGFNGFQVSVLVWMFLGGLVAVERMDGKGSVG